MNSSIRPIDFIGKVVQVSYRQAMFVGCCFGFVACIIIGTYTAFFVIWLLATLLLPVSFAVHELGHYFAALLCRANPVMYIEKTRISVLSNPLRMWQAAVISLSGPLAVVMLIIVISPLQFVVQPRVVMMGMQVLVVAAHLVMLLPGFADGRVILEAIKGGAL